MSVPKVIRYVPRRASELFERAARRSKLRHKEISCRRASEKNIRSGCINSLQKATTLLFSVPSLRNKAQATTPLYGQSEASRISPTLERQPQFSELLHLLGSHLCWWTQCGACLILAGCERCSDCGIFSSTFRIIDSELWIAWMRRCMRRKFQRKLLVSIFDTFLLWGTLVFMPVLMLGLSFVSHNSQDPVCNTLFHFHAFSWNIPVSVSLNSHLEKTKTQVDW